jgi:hypothetical protein
MFGCSAIISTGIGVASFGLFFGESSSRLLTEYNCAGTEKSSRLEKSLAAPRLPQIAAQAVDLLDRWGFCERERRLSLWTGFW